MRHVCSPSIFDYERQHPQCSECGAPMTRIEHGPGHRINGQPCGYPDTWRYCFLPDTVVEQASTDLLAVPPWRLA